MTTTMNLVPDYDDGLQKGQMVKIDIPAPDGDMEVTATVLDRREADNQDGTARYFKIQKIMVQGEDRTEEYLEKAFGGERVRGVPDEQLRDAVIEVVDT